MFQENLQIMIMQNFGGVKEVYYGIVQVVNEENKNVTPAHMNCIKFRGVINSLTTKISKSVGLIAKLRQIVVNRTPPDICKPLIVPYITYGLTSWGNASNTLLNKGLVLQKRALRLIPFAQAREHAIPLFLKGKLLPLEFLCYEKIVKLMCADIITNSAPICSLKIPVFILTAHAYQHVSIFSPNNPHLAFKVRPFHVLALKSGMGYQLV